MPIPLMRLGDIQSSLESATSWQARLELLTASYLKLAQPVPALVRLLAVGGKAAAPVADRFKSLFNLAIADLQVSKAQRKIAMNLLVDFIHGYALAGAKAKSGWRAELGLTMLGIEAIAKQSKQHADG